jgi:glycosyltransferase involved in cell wall biosynthesis
VVVTVQDHRIFCPGIGKTLPDGSPCGVQMGDAACTWCLPDAEYRARMLELTRRRRDALRGARLLVLSQYMAEELAAAGLAGAEVLPPWVEVSEQPPEAGGHFLLGGRLVAHKGVLEAHRAWRAAATGLPLRVAGSGPLEDRLHGCERLGWLPVRELRRQLCSARALLFPARWQEPFGMLGVEALAEATPVVVAAAGGTGEWSGRGCLRVAAGDVPALAEAVHRLARQPERATALGLEGRAAVAARFARQVIVDRLLAVYRELSRGSTPDPLPRAPR